MALGQNDLLGLGVGWRPLLMEAQGNSLSGYGLKLALFPKYHL